MLSQLRPALLVILAFTLLTGVVYPLAVTGVAQLVFPHQANGSLVERDGVAVGSTLIGQEFTDPGYFWGRLSATEDFPFNAASSSGSNLAPTNPELLDAARTRIEALRAADPGNTDPVPVDLVTGSGSGLDPHISPAGALFQAERVARARGMNLTAVQQLIERHTEGRTFGLLGEPRVNVLLLNLALDEAAPLSQRQAAN